MIRTTPILIAATCACLAGCATAGRVPQTLTSHPERTDFRETSRYADVVAFMEASDRASPLIHLTTFGTTNEGRALPLAVVGRVADASPAAVRASGKTVVYLQGNIHAGEVEGKESLQILLREIAVGRHGALLDSLVLLIAPIYNADGNERIDAANRPRQHGPIGGMGVRPNAQGLDLNRDHTKLESPEARGLARMLSEYDPHVVIDLHTTNGTYHGYHLTYAPPMHPNTPVEIDRILRREWLPAVTAGARQGGWL
ncbi:MAG TPA: M14 family zinc carboxypeptidase, partial [Longimicrobium sp.]|nr:M14 family zinc carboxypeptidase [Longimicrobium sp.]